MREKEYETISEKLSRPGVEFVPCTRIGRDLPFDAIAREWGFSAVILANGAWRDRPLPVEGADAYVVKEKISVTPGSIADPVLIQDNASKLRNFYEEESGFRISCLS